MNKRPFKIGITGGIGSGKSVVCQVFECLGTPVYYADDRAKWLMNHDLNLKHGIITAFGEESYSEGVLNRQFLANHVFHDQQKLQSLNALVHPVVAQDTKTWEEDHAHRPYILREAALFYELGIDRQMDVMLVVASDEDLRIARVKKRDPQRSDTQIKAIIQKQMAQEEKVKRADFVIWNNEESEILNQINAFLGHMI